MKFEKVSVLWFSAAALAFPQTGNLRTIDFGAEIHPVFESRCRSCHSGDAAQGGFRIGSREDLVRGGASGPAIVPGKGAESLLVKKVTGQRGLRMPPSGAPLTEDVVASIRQWIDQGAPWTASGASVSGRLAPIAPRTPPMPAGTSSLNPVDRFVKTGPARVSDAVFARRAYLDLWGLLPPVEDLQAFVASKDPDKRARLVDRLLSDREKYAEHWISFWNDLLRNDEGVVYHGDRKSITGWLLGALKTNMPYSAMVRALLNPTAKDDPDGFLVGVNWRGVVSASQSPPMQAAQNSAQIFLGMNLKCAACHDSFVNRWKLRDTFGLAAMFSTEKLELVRCDVPTGRMAEARFPIGDLKVEFGETLESRRGAVAEWFTSRENGRFARTIVNRYWRALFGRGIVEPIDDMDAEPWSQDLLDALASGFVEHGESLQHLLKVIMTSSAYQLPSDREMKPSPKYTFKGPLPRRLTAEQFQDAISQVTGDWRVRVPRNEIAGVYTREWRLKSDPLSRALGRPIRDQVYTERATQATTLQALEMTNGPLLSERLERAARVLLGEQKPAPSNRFDSKLVRSGAAPIDIDITGAKDLYLVIEDVDSYDAARIVAGWADSELIRLDGSPTPLSKLPGPSVQARQFELPKGEFAAGFMAASPSVLHWQLGQQPFTRFKARAVIDESSRKSDISPAIRFFVFTEEPEADRMVHIEGAPPMSAPAASRSSSELADRLYLQLFSREPSAAERAIAVRTLGAKPTAAGVEDLLWAMLMSPEFQFIR